ncbi:MAG: CopG family transcriptional regulator [Thermoplasmata archaeon]|nr:MAG: CopG family transcriptional regulator [Thermoplasmata archaeon]
MEGKKDEKKFTTISIPTPLADKIKKRIEGTGFHSLSSYVTYVLRELLASMEEEEAGEALTKEDEEKIKERLRALGYLD